MPRHANLRPEVTTADSDDVWRRHSHPVVRAVSRRHRSIAVLYGRSKLAYWLILAAWVAANILFWSWWLQPERPDSALAYAVFTLPFAYDAVILPTVFLFFIGQMRKPRYRPYPTGARVALITLCVPAKESIDVITRELEALVRVKYPHDSWVLDEGDAPAVRALADRLGVHYFSRAGVARYNQPNPPFAAKTKAGNVNAWLDAHGYAYDFFVQLDIDHRPDPEYLYRVLGYFEDADVAWVQGPSLYGNLDSWVARGAAEQELVLQGPLQRGFYGFSETPFIIGSHCTYRTSAVLEIGGFQPTRAEDHLDTVVLSSRGYRGVFVPEVLATGNGPDSFETYIRQQFAWAYSMMQILGGYWLGTVLRLRPRQALQFTFAQTWYPFWSLSMLMLFALPVFVLLTGARPSAVDLPTFLMMSAPLTIMSSITWLWTRPHRMPLGLGLSWRGVVLHVARWPIVVWALINVLLHVKHPYMITPKGSREELPRFSLQSQALYLALAIATVAVVWGHRLVDSPGATDGYALFALASGTWMLAVVVANVVADSAELVRRRFGALAIWRARWVPTTVLATVAMAVTLTVLSTEPQVAESAVYTESVPIHEAVSTVYIESAPIRETLAAAATSVDASISVFEVALAEPSAREPEAVALGPVGAEASPSPVVSATTSASDQPAFAPGNRIGLAALRQVEVADRRPGAAAAASASVAPGRSDPRLVLPSGHVAVGAYSARSVAPSLDIVHIFVADEEPSAIRRALGDLAPSQTLLVTLESMPDPDGVPNILHEVADGKRDETLAATARTIAAVRPRPVMVRWGHEMELVGLYPWSQPDASLYRDAYRRVVEVFRSNGADNVLWVWSPAGNLGALAYYPGDDVVDYVGLTVLGDAIWDRGFGMSPQTFEQLIGSRYQLVSGLAKPIIVAEVGVSGSSVRQDTWLADAALALDRFPLVRAIVYFDSVNAANNRMLTQPDWRLGDSRLAQFAYQVRASTGAARHVERWGSVPSGLGASMAVD